MSAVVLEKHLVNVESGTNANKFYQATLLADGSIQTRWGRVGAAGQSQVKQGGRSAFDSLIRAKSRKGYTEVDVLAPSTTMKSGGENSRLRETAAASLIAAANPQLTDLVDRLVAANKHNLMEASGGLITVDVSGQVTTPLGIISARSLADARRILTQMSSMSGGSQRTKLTEEYLRLVPQKVSVSAGRGWAGTWLDTMTSVKTQAELLDALDASVSYADQTRRNAEDAASKAEGKAPVQSDFFRYKVDLVDPGSDEYQSVIARYQDTVQDVHQWAKARKLKRVYRLEDTQRAPEIADAHERVRNVRRLWHGTGAANVLSIMQKGLFVPPTRGSGIHIAGRMFGDGIYLSRSASKSLGYSVGVWGGGRSGGTFMFLTETAMGNELRPSGPHYDQSLPRRARTEKNSRGRAYDSINVNAGTGGVRNHEAVVWEADQVKLSWLVEFD